MEKVRALFMVLACFLGGLSGEALLLLESHSRGAERELMDDFRIIVFLKPHLPPGREKVVEEKIGVLPGIEGIRYVSAEEAMEQLRTEEPELAHSAAGLGGNPLPDSFEVRLAAHAMTRAAHWADEIIAMADIADVRYKSLQVRAILKAQYYGRLFSLLLHSALSLTGFAVAAGLWLLRETPSKPRFSEAGLAAAAAALGMFLCAALLHPMRELASGNWPSAFAQLLLIFGITGLYTLCPRS